MPPSQKKKSDGGKDGEGGEQGGETEKKKESGTVLRDVELSFTESGVGGPFLATGGSGDGADGALTVELRSNATNIEIEASGGNLVGVNTAGNLPFADITASDGGTIPVPDFGATQSLNAGPYSLSDTWSYTYDNTNVYVPDEYNGTVTYTVTTL